jgi:hypothetical protein
MAQSTASGKVTTDHQQIRRWVEARGGHPATVKRTKRGGGPGLLRIDYPGFSGEEELAEISWDEFFDKFEQSKLAFVYQDKTARGRSSRFSKLVSRDTVERTRGARGGRRKSASGRAATARSTRARKTSARKSAAGSTARRKSATKRTARRRTTRTTRRG